MLRMITNRGPSTAPLTRLSPPLRAGSDVLTWLFTIP